MKNGRERREAKEKKIEIVRVVGTPDSVIVVKEEDNSRRKV